MGWFSKKKLGPKEVYFKYKGVSRISGNQYIDPDGFEYGRECVGCHDCIFRTKGSYLSNGCRIYSGSDTEIARKTQSVIKNKYCDFFLDRSFDLAEEAVKNMN